MKVKDPFTQFASYVRVCTPTISKISSRLCLEFDCDEDASQAYHMLWCAIDDTNDGTPAEPAKEK